MSGALAAPILPTNYLVIHPSSIGPPPGGCVRREEEELNDRALMATELGTPGTHSALWGQGLLSLGLSLRRQKEPPPDDSRAQLWTRAKRSAGQRISGDTRKLPLHSAQVLALEYMSS